MFAYSCLLFGLFVDVVVKDVSSCRWIWLELWCLVKADRLQLVWTWFVMAHQCGLYVTSVGKFCM